MTLRMVVSTQPLEPARQSTPGFFTGDWWLQYGLDGFAGGVIGGLAVVATLLVQRWQFARTLKHARQQQATQFEHEMQISRAALAHERELSSEARAHERALIASTELREAVARLHALTSHVRLRSHASRTNAEWGEMLADLYSEITVVEAKAARQSKRLSGDLLTASEYLMASIKPKPEGEDFELPKATIRRVATHVNARSLAFLRTEPGVYDTLPPLDFEDGPAN